MDVLLRSTAAAALMLPVETTDITKTLKKKAFFATH